MNDKTRERLLDLLADRATGSLDPGDVHELETLLASLPPGAEEEVELAAAALGRALTKEEEMPGAVRSRIEDEAMDFFKAQRDVEAAPLRRAPSRISVLSSARWGWMAAAATLIVALSLWMTAPRSPEIPVPGEARQTLLAEAADVKTTAWSATEDRSSVGTDGDVVWSPSRQEGYMRIRNLESNDPARSQYQLWIFDRERDERYPIDGGVFDIPAGATEVVVPIRAKLPVADVTLFAVTVEPPGGVVVSSRERIVLVAQPI